MVRRECITSPCSICHCEDTPRCVLDKHTRIHKSGEIFANLPCCPRPWRSSAWWSACWRWGQPASPPAPPPPGCRGWRPGQGGCPIGSTEDGFEETLNISGFMMIDITLITTSLQDCNWSSVIEGEVVVGWGAVGVFCVVVCWLWCCGGCPVVVATVATGCGGGPVVVTWPGAWSCGTSQSSLPATQPGHSLPVGLVSNSRSQQHSLAPTSTQQH